MYSVQKGKDFFLIHISILLLYQNNLLFTKTAVLADYNLNFHLSWSFVVLVSKVIAVELSFCFCSFLHLLWNKVLSISCRICLQMFKSVAILIFVNIQSIDASDSQWDIGPYYQRPRVCYIEGGSTNMPCSSLISKWFLALTVREFKTCNEQNKKL